MNNTTQITRPHGAAMDELCDQLAELTPSLEAPDAWPAHQLELCGQYGVYQWFIPRELGGQGWSDADVIRGYLRLSAACLTTTFVITQRTGACRRIAFSDHDSARQQCLGPLLTGKRFATVGISHLTTSRQHLSRPALLARCRDTGIVLDGLSPWVTGAAYADWIVTGATLDDGRRQVLAAVPRDTPGMTVLPTSDLMALTASQTGPVAFENVELAPQWLLAGPAENVMKSGVGAKAGGLQTSTLAAGLANSAITYLESESTSRPALAPATKSFRGQWQQLIKDLLAGAEGEPVCSNEELRARANSLVLRTTQSALSAAKGAGYVAGHPVGRWCREALFFMVWSCPQPVQQAGLCELAGIITPSFE